MESLVFGGLFEILNLKPQTLNPKILSYELGSKTGKVLGHAIWMVHGVPRGYRLHTQMCRAFARLNTDWTSGLPNARRCCGGVSDRRQVKCYV